MGCGSGRIFSIPPPVAPPFLDRGYALLFAHVTPRLNEPGPASVECATTSVEAAAATGIVDRERVGLTGHSFGGYEAFFIATQTDLFKAVVPTGGFTNLWSYHGSLYADVMFNGVGMETHQPFMAGPWWESWQAYLENSPLYHVRSLRTPMLIIHGDRDEAAPFSQAVEFYAAAYRLADKPVVMLQYIGADHVATDPGNDSDTGRDARDRMMQFFDHFLKDAPAPGWWRDGQSIPAGEVAAVDRISSTH